METLIGKDLQTAEALLKQGALVAIPTETVYGLAANALDTPAVLNIFETKGRPTFNPLIVHVPDLRSFEKYAESIPEVAYVLAEKFCPGPLTFVLPKKNIVPDIVTGGGNTVAIRIPAHPMTLELLNLLDFPLAAPSANPFGYISPVTAAHVYKQMNGRIPYILDGDACKVGLESTVISFVDNEVVVLRAGGITIEVIKAIHPHVTTSLQISSNPQSPGQLKTHYAPKIPFLLGNIETLTNAHPHQRIGVLSFQKEYQGENIKHCEVMSPNGDLKEAARELFSKMRLLDDMDIDIIIAEKVPDQGFGVAINDRLTRAAATED